MENLKAQTAIADILLAGGEEAERFRSVCASVAETLSAVAKFQSVASLPEIHSVLSKTQSQGLTSVNLPHLPPIGGIVDSVLASSPRSDVILTEVKRNLTAEELAELTADFVEASRRPQFVQSIQLGKSVPEVKTEPSVDSDSSKDPVIARFKKQLANHGLSFGEFLEILGLLIQLFFSISSH